MGTWCHKSKDIIMVGNRQLSLLYGLSVKHLFGGRHGAVSCITTEKLLHGHISRPCFMAGRHGAVTCITTEKLLHGHISRPRVLRWVCSHTETEKYLHGLAQLVCLI